MTLNPLVHLGMLLLALTMRVGPNGSPLFSLGIKSHVVEVFDVAKQSFASMDPYYTKNTTTHSQIPPPFFNESFLGYQVVGYYSQKNEVIRPFIGISLNMETSWQTNVPMT